MGQISHLELAHGLNEPQAPGAGSGVRHCPLLALCTVTCLQGGLALPLPARIEPQQPALPPPYMPGLGPLLPELGLGSLVPPLYAPECWGWTLGA